jgi:hypothetical protein
MVPEEAFSVNKGDCFEAYIFGKIAKLLIFLKFYYLSAY